jgi:predicted dienelactone hydrolase
MRVLEVVLLVVALGTAMVALRTIRRSRSRMMPSARRHALRSPAVVTAAVLLLVAMLAQSLLEGLRWQLAPVTASALLFVALLGVRIIGLRAPLVRTTAGVTAAAALVSAGLGWALPVRVLSEPEGPHAVGTTTIVLHDEARPERYGPAPGAPREIVLQLWYPADPDAAAGAPRAVLMPEARAFADLGAAELGLPTFALGHLSQVRGHAAADVAALGGAPLPLVVLSHGWTGFRVIQADLAEQLASAGYVVAAPDHTFGALVTTFPDGRAVRFDPEALPEWETVPDDVYVERSRALVATFAADIALVVRALEQAPPGPLDGRIDTTRLALIGHSTGGGAAIAACAVETRCMAVVGFDPWVDPVDPTVLRSGIDAPLLSLRTEDWVERPNEVQLGELHARQGALGRAEGRVTIEGALHRDYTLIPALSPLGGLLGFEGSTPGEHTRSTTLRWTRGFLDHHLRGLGTDPLLDPPVTEAGTLEPRNAP